MDLFYLNYFTKTTCYQPPPWGFSSVHFSCCICSEIQVGLSELFSIFNGAHTRKSHRICNEIYLKLNLSKLLKFPIFYISFSCIWRTPIFPIKWHTQQIEKCLRRKCFRICQLLWGSPLDPMPALLNLSTSKPCSRTDLVKHWVSVLVTTMYPFFVITGSFILGVS